MKYPAAVVRAKRALNPLIDTTFTRLRRTAGEHAFLEAVEEARTHGTVRVNMGSGGEPIPGWVNCDIVWRVPVYLDATQRWPVPDDSVNFVYADNVIEHVTLELGRQIFRHTFAALQPGGVFRLATPDVEAASKQYLENGELARLGLDRHREQGRNFDHPVQLLQYVFVGAKHYLGFCYDYDSISAEMQAAGFVVSRQPAGESEYLELRGLETRLHPAEEATSLIVEGLKATT